MTASLLDVSVLIALMWPTHEAHNRVLRWFGRSARHGWATCPMTQAGFVRLVSNPAFSRDAVSPAAALAILDANLRNEHHHFWEDDCGVGNSGQQFRARFVGHRQVTYAYLLGLAVRKGGHLVTLDGGLRALASRDLTKDAVHLIR